MKFHVEYALRSARKLGKIRDYLIEESRSRETADRFLTQLLDACETLDSLPERFPRYPFAPDWRMMPFGNYLVFFRIHENAVRICHIRHAARKPFRG